MTDIKTTLLKTAITSVIVSVSFLPLSIYLESDWLLRISAIGLATTFFFLVILSLAKVWGSDE